MERKMRSDQRIKLTGMAILALTVFVSGWFMPTAQAQTDIAEKIHRDGKLPGGVYRSLVTSKFGCPRTARANPIAALEVIR